ncbi:hypothetical protein Bca52824_096785 [Brassica carinata]|uniref:Uncharacterized protein n=1 Tax=Brassica carinata TaxID=52824 RepID=A0A8X7THG4_BRACI|nr:hypothetical protein Bca52824_096785 [Brassica carinata]
MNPHPCLLRRRRERVSRTPRRSRWSTEAYRLKVIGGELGEGLIVRRDETVTRRDNREAKKPPVMEETTSSEAEEGAAAAEEDEEEAGRVLQLRRRCGDRGGRGSRSHGAKIRKQDRERLEREVGREGH